MGFTQEMMTHNGKAVKTTRNAENQNVFRALCLDTDGELAIDEGQKDITFGNFIDALLSQGVKEALYTDMGPGWNYCFYRINLNEKSPRYLHDTPRLKPQTLLFSKSNRLMKSKLRFAILSLVALMVFPCCSSGSKGSSCFMFRII